LPDTMEMRSSNPVLNNNFWSNLAGTERMTVEGSMQKTGYLLGVTVLSALVSAVLCLNAINNGDGGFLVSLLWMGGMVGGLVIALLLMFIRPNNPATLMTMYALFEGAFIGAFSVVFESMYEGIVFQAAFGTVGITATMYLMYASRVIRPTPMFNKVVGGLVVSIMFLYLTSFILSLVSGYSVPFLHSTGPIGIGVTLFILVVASLTLISDFGFIESGSRQGAPKNMEWYAAFGILMSLIWIYIEMVRLLWKLNAYRD
jgi:uncharacterized YccA/Bax inhibitor family protein